MTKLIAALTAAVALSTPASYLQSQQQPDGGWGSPQMTAWVALGLRAAGADTSGALDYLVAHEAETNKPTEIALVALAEAALGHDPQSLLARFTARPTAVNTAIWQILALRQSGRDVPRTLLSYLRASQARNGGFAWVRGTAPDSNDTAAAVQALRAAGVSGKPISRALAYLRKLQAPSGGFRLSAGREADAQSTALVIQAFVAARVKAPSKAFVFLSKLRRPDGSFRYSRSYATTPVWVTAQVLPALVKKPFPLR
ncbi:MAG TPA: prenyltransferase/squalene oxidase repeat-containing protein [Gaiellaceae bacterium]